jgi:argininosuccinate lyase
LPPPDYHGKGEQVSIDKPWGGRFREATNRMVEEFTASIGFDRRLYRQDIAGSKAHSRMLGAVGIISEDDVKRLHAALDQVQEEIDSGSFPFSVSREDIHMNIEHRLGELVGAELAGRLHTARSRNDQVALDVRLYVRDAAVGLREQLAALIRAYVRQAAAGIDVVMPGFTHLQSAQPVLLAHHLLAYVEMFSRDYDRLGDLLARADECPLGAGALAGTSFPIDRWQVAKELGFSRLTANSMDAVSDRDGVLELVFACAMIMMHLSRGCEELVLWSSVQFDFVRLADSFCTGSSIMPQKKNPDVPELIRGKCGRVTGSLVALLMNMKALPLAYNKDMQEDKEPLFDAVDTVGGSLGIMAPLVETLDFRCERLALLAGAGFSTATEVADYLVRRGLPFRQAHEIVGRVVAYCDAREISLEELTLADWRGFSTLFDADITAYLSAAGAVDSKDVYGGTARRQVILQVRRAAARWDVEVQVTE